MYVLWWGNLTRNMASHPAVHLEGAKLTVYKLYPRKPEL